MRPSLPADVRALGRTPLFRGCTNRQLFNAQRYGTIVDAAAGRVLCRQGQQPGQFVVIVSGRLITVASSGAHRMLSYGDWFGALASPGQPNVEPEGVAAVTASVLFVVSRQEFAGLEEACPDFGARLTSGSLMLRARTSEQPPSVPRVVTTPQPRGKTPCRSRPPVLIVTGSSPRHNPLDDLRNGSVR
jgi:CRP-like cAMP-binding protein